MGYKYNYFTSHFHGLTKVDNDIALDPLTGVIHALGLVQLNLEVDQLPHPASVPWPLDLVKRLLFSESLEMASESKYNNDTITHIRSIA